MGNRILVVGAGMAGLSAALACTRAGWRVQMLEQSPALLEVGAGLQLGPNATRILIDWGLADALQACAAFPPALAVVSARSGAVLAQRTLGASIRQRYGAPYATLARADLQQLLLHAVQGAGVALALGQTVGEAEVGPDRVQLQTGPGASFEAELLVGADGLWSRLRALWDATPPKATGHEAYRALLRLQSLPAALREPRIVAWLGPAFHVVQYPVRGGEWLNIVAIVHAQTPAASNAGWDHAADAAELLAGTRGAAAGLRALLEAVPAWRRWPLYDRDPVRGPADLARGRMALLGDAAHPMRPYLAQGAAMAMEDAYVLGQRLRAQPSAPQQALAEWAQARWARNARVQKRSRRNGTVFHWAGLSAWARDLALRSLGERLLALDWLYAGPS